MTVGTSLSVLVEPMDYVAMVDLFPSTNVLIAFGELGQWAKDIDCNHMHWVFHLHSVHRCFACS